MAELKTKVGQARPHDRPHAGPHAQARASAATASEYDAPGEGKVLNHNYDGILEYDNPMPFWWTSVFLLSILFTGPYFVYYHFGVGATMQQNYESEVGAFVEAQTASLGDIKPLAPTILSLVSDAKLKMGAGVMFRSNCAVCHGPEGGGVTGPNLTDSSYLNVNKVEDIFRVIKDGVVAKGMPEWGKRFSEPQLILLASYVASLRGTSPAESKAAQGSPIAAWLELTSVPPKPTTSVLPTQK
ncbi:MAG: cbb3-type cytochrome c oxidase N-terminal domain-containing protein [Phycisphaerae bacterium]|nr:cbb3-type cytochrome c oxidase N-terminal domain-containing protein [Phycisphaerae bacterium]